MCPRVEGKAGTNGKEQGRSPSSEALTASKGRSPSESATAGLPGRQ